MNERRKYPRYSEQVYLKLYVYDTEGNPSKINDFIVRTVDVSLGGLRMEGPRELATGSRVGFEADDDTTSHSISGIGEVKWCKTSEKPDHFELGVAFPIVIQPRA